MAAVGFAASMISTPAKPPRTFPSFLCANAKPKPPVGAKGFRAQNSVSWDSQRSRHFPSSSSSSFSSNEWQPSKFRELCSPQSRGIGRRNASVRAGASSSSGGPSQDGLLVKENGPASAILIRDLSLDINTDKGKVPVLRGCTLSVPEGQFWMLLGPNGCGKSTLLRAMSGLLKPNWGHMFLQGPRSFVLQNPDYQVVMPTAEADVAFGLGRFELTHEEVSGRVHRALEAVAMGEFAQRPVQTLSGGQKQRIAIAGALAESSKLLLFDEITTYLDGGDQTSVLEAVRSVVGGPQAVTALWVTHRLEELDYADGAAYMEHGRVVLNGDVKEVKRYIEKQQRFQN